jgi:plastocyanin
MRSAFALPAILALLCCAADPARAQPSTPAQEEPAMSASPPTEAPPLAAGMARVEGKVTFAGLAPKLAALPVSRDLKLCDSTKPDESLLVGPDGGIRFAVLSIDGAPAPRRGPGEKPPRVRLDQRGCQFIPHLLVTTAGAELDIVNSDNVLHNVHAYVGDATVFNYAMPIKNYVIPRRLPKPGVLRISCDVHPWMRAVVDVLSTSAFAVTDAQGAYFIDVAPGKYTLRLWHERLGERTFALELASGHTLRQDIQLTPR